MPLTKACPRCCSVVNVMKLACPCGHIFTIRQKRPVITRKSKRLAMKQKRGLELESDTRVRQQNDRVARTQKRALESHDEAFHQKLAYTAKKRSFETHGEALSRKEHDRTYRAKKRAFETDSEILTRKEQNRACTAKKRSLETDSVWHEKSSIEHVKLKRGP